MSFNQVNVKNFENQSANIMQGGCVRPPLDKIPVRPPICWEPPIFINPPRCGEPPIFRIPPGEIPPRFGPRSEDAVPERGKPFLGRDCGLPRGKEADVYRTDDGRIILNAGEGNDNIKVSKSNCPRIDGRNVCVEVNGEKYFFTEEQAKKLEIHGGAGDDNITVDGNLGFGLNIHGNSGDDKIVGGDGNDRIYGGSGNDTIYGRSGDDYIHGGSGDDNIYGGSGNDYLVGGEGRDRLIGGSGRNTIIQEDFSIWRLMNNLRRV
jgi:RTX calcium-binding nonapeptide repeat (4 copies)